MPDKQCKRCEEVKPLSAFYDRQSCKDGVRPVCKQCYNHMRVLSQSSDESIGNGTSDQLRLQVVSPDGVTVCETVVPEVALEKVREYNVRERLTGRPLHMKYRIARRSALPPLGKDTGAHD